MIELTSALVAPLAKALLKSCLGDVPADIGGNLLNLGFQRFGDRSKAKTAKQHAERIAGEVVTSLESFFASEHADPTQLEVAAYDLGTTVGDHVDAAFLMRQKLNAEEIQDGLLRARPIDEIYRPAEPERDLYIRLVKALAPRLREIASKLPLYTEERDAQFFAELAQLADDTAQILAGIEGIRDKLDEMGDQMDILEQRAREAKTANATKPTIARLF